MTEAEIRSDESKRIVAMLDRMAEVRRGSYRAAAELITGRDICRPEPRQSPPRGNQHDES